MCSISQTLSSKMSVFLLIVCSLLAPFSTGSRMMFHHQGFYGELDDHGVVSMGLFRDDPDSVNPYGDPNQVSLILDELRLLGPNRDMLQNYAFGGETETAERVIFALNSEEEHIRYQGVSMRSRSMWARLPGLASNFTVTVYIFAEDGVINAGTPLETDVERGSVLIILKLERSGVCQQCDQEGAKLQVLTKAFGIGPVQQTPEAPRDPDEEADVDGPSYMSLDLGGGTTMLVPRKATLDDYEEEMEHISVTEREKEAIIMLDFAMFTNTFEMGTLITLGQNVQVEEELEEDDEEAEAEADDDTDDIYEDDDYSDDDEYSDEYEYDYDDDDTYDEGYGKDDYSKDDENVGERDNGMDEGEDDDEIYTTASVKEEPLEYENKAEQMTDTSGNPTGLASSVHEMNMLALLIFSLCLAVLMSKEML